MPRSKQYYIRRTHRYLGLILGIQFLLWTIGGLYFSWSDIDEIHGDFQHRRVPRLPGHMLLVSPQVALSQVSGRVDSIDAVVLVNILRKPFFSIAYFSSGKLQKVLADAQTGQLRKPVDKAEAIRIAAEQFSGEPDLQLVEYISSTSGHHEYRAKPLPAWAVTFRHPGNTTVYVSAEYGRVESFRNNKWRVFDFLWMLHTMDYNSRDDINNVLLRIFSVAGLLTVFSGFALFVVSSRFARRRKMKLLQARQTKVG